LWWEWLIFVSVRRIKPYLHLVWRNFRHSTQNLSLAFFTHIWQLYFAFFFVGFKSQFSRWNFNLWISQCDFILKLMEVKIWSFNHREILNPGCLKITFDQYLGVNLIFLVLFFLKNYILLICFWFNFMIKTLKFINFCLYTLFFLNLDINFRISMNQTLFDKFLSNLSWWFHLIFL